MFRFFVALICLSQSFFSTTALATPSPKPIPFMTCTELGINPQVQIKIFSLYDKSAVRVEIHEIENGNETVFLNDLRVSPEQEQGIYQNSMFRLVVEPAQGSTRQHSAHLDFLYDSTIRSSAELMCQTMEAGTF